MFNQQLSDEEQQRIDEEIDAKLAQEEEWERTYGHLFKEDDKIDKYSGGTLGAQQERMKTNKEYERRKDKGDFDVKINKK